MSIAYTKTEYLSELLGNTDDSILEEAFAIDSAASLTRAKARQRWKKAKAFALSETARRAGAFVACAAIVITMLLSIPAALRYVERMIEISSGVVVDIPVSELIPVGETVVIDSLDKLNYYSGLRALDGKLGLNSAKIAPIYTSESLALATGKKFFAPDGELEITMASFFCIMIDSDDGYLYERFGEGKAYVVITKNNFANMMTVRRGDDFYTCFATEEEDGRMVFTSERYADGFAIAEQTEGEKFKTIVEFDGKSPEKLKLVDESGKERSVELLRGTAAFSDDVTILSINELEKYYANKFPYGTDKENANRTDKESNEVTDEPTDEVTEKLNELVSYEGVFGSEDDYRGTLSFPNLSNQGKEHIAVWKSNTLGEYTLTIRVDKGEIIFASEDGSVAGTIELYDDRIYLNVEYSTSPEMLLGSYMFEVK